MILKNRCLAKFKTQKSDNTKMHKIKKKKIKILYFLFIFLKSMHSLCFFRFYLRCDPSKKLFVLFSQIRVTDELHLYLLFITLFST